MKNMKTIKLNYRVKQNIKRCAVSESRTVDCNEVNDGGYVF